MRVRLLDGALAGGALQLRLWQCDVCVAPRPFGQVLEASDADHRTMGGLGSPHHSGMLYHPDTPGGVACAGLASALLVAVDFRVPLGREVSVLHRLVVDVVVD